MVDWYIPLRLMDNIMTTALGESLDWSLVWTLIDYVLPRTFGFVKNSLGRSLVGALARERRWKVDAIVDLTPRQDW